MDNEHTSEPDADQLCWILAQDLYQIESKYDTEPETERDRVALSILYGRARQVEDVLKELELMGVDTVERAYAHVRGSEFPEIDDTHVPPWQDPEDDSAEFKKTDSSPPSFTAIPGSVRPPLSSDEE